MATLIQELGIGVTELLTDDTILLPEDLKDVLQQQYDRTIRTRKTSHVIVGDRKPASQLRQIATKLTNIRHQIC